tara:strand:+ start:9274 stop:9507 length:234 start_codon:yes stop_codon:yes gene_type:complete
MKGKKEEKVFSFTKMVDPTGNPIKKQVKESMLSKTEQELLFNELKNKFNESPTKVKSAFVQYIIKKVAKHNVIQKRT